MALLNRSYYDFILACILLLSLLLCYYELAQGVQEKNEKANSIKTALTRKRQMKVKQTNSHGKPTIQQPNNGEKKLVACSILNQTVNLLQTKPRGGEC